MKNDIYEIKIMIELKMKEIETINLHMKEDLLRFGAFQCDYQSEINKLNLEIINSMENIRLRIDNA